jgi:hypothetical protein
MIGTVPQKCRSRSIEDNPTDAHEPAPSNGITRRFDSVVEMSVLR